MLYQKPKAQAPQPSDGDPPSAPVVPADTSPTWELELLISGAVLYSLFKAPGAVSALFERLRPHVSGAADTALFMTYYYTTSAIYALLAIFVVHLVARSYWVGIVGLNTVFPGGIRWDRFESGPNVRRVYQENTPPLGAIASRTDNFCSTLFSFGFLIVLVFLVSLILVAVGGGVWVAIAPFTSGDPTSPRSNRTPLIVLGVSLLLPLFGLADKIVGKRLDPDGRAARVIRGANRFMYRVFWVRSYGPILLTLRTNLPKRVFGAVFNVMIVGVLAVFLLQFIIERGALSLSGARYIPEEGGRHSVDVSFYESMRARGPRFALRPSIQSDIIRDPYVKLFIPYSIERHNAALRARCPALTPLRPDGVHFHLPTEGGAPDSAVVAALRCLADLHRVTLNNAPIPGLEFRFYTHPETGVDGIIAYIPVDSLPRGRNEVRLHPVPRLRPPPGAKPFDPYVIPFWR